MQSDWYKSLGYVKIPLVFFACVPLNLCAVAAVVLTAHKYSDLLVAGTFSLLTLVTVYALHAVRSLLTNTEDLMGLMNARIRHSAEPECAEAVRQLQKAAEQSTAVPEGSEGVTPTGGIRI